MFTPTSRLTTAPTSAHGAGHENAQGAESLGGNRSQAAGRRLAVSNDVMKDAC